MPPRRDTYFVALAEAWLEAIGPDVTVKEVRNLFDNIKVGAVDGAIDFQLGGRGGPDNRRLLWSVEAFYRNWGDLVERLPPVPLSNRRNAARAIVDAV